MSRVDDVARGKRAHEMAVRALLNLDQHGVELQVDLMKKFLDPPDERKTGSWLLDGIRMSAFFAYERQDVAALRRHHDEVWVLSKRHVHGNAGPPAIPGVAAFLWLRGWIEEISGDARAARATRKYACGVRGVLGRAKELANSTDLPPGDKVEARLLVDLYTDLVRSARAAPAPVRLMAKIEDKFGSTPDQNPYLKLARRGDLSFFSARRLFMRMAFELADRGDPNLRRDRQQLLYRVIDLERLDHPTHPSRWQKQIESDLAEVDRPLIELEKQFAFEGSCSAAQAEERKQRAESIADRSGLERRKSALQSMWPTIVRHGW